MNKLLIVLQSLFVIQNFYSQDSIAFISKEIVAVKLVEIGINDVKYFRLDNLNGPKYTVSKRDIKLIKYASGKTDTIKMSRESLEMQNQLNRIIIARNRLLVYPGHVLSDMELYGLIKGVSKKEQTIKLFSEFSLMKKFKRKQYTSWYGGLLLGVIAMVTIQDIEWSNRSKSQKDIETSLAIGFGSLALATGTGFSIYFKNKKTKKKFEIARLYNECI